VPQGSPLSPLLANIALNDLDYALERGRGYLTYTRYLDDMVVLTPNSQKGRGADRALERIRREAAAIGVSLNAEKTRTVTMTDRRANFAFLGFEFRWEQSPRTGKWYAHMCPRKKKVTEVLSKVRDTLRDCRALPIRVAAERVNSILRGWVNYFRVGNSGQAFGKVRQYVERKVRRFVAKRAGRRGLGWKRWSKEVVYGAWGLNGHEAGKGGYSQGPACTPPLHCLLSGQLLEPASRDNYVDTHRLLELSGCSMEQKPQQVPFNNALQFILPANGCGACLARPCLDVPHHVLIPSAFYGYNIMPISLRVVWSCSKP
jgi:hypothetical protein